MKKKFFVILAAILVLCACTPAKPITDPGPVSSKVDIRDKTALYTYLKNEIIDITREQFDQWGIVYCDLTKDGAEDAVLVSPNVAWHDKVEIVSSDGGRFARVASEIPLAKYANVAAYEDGFLVMVGGTGGPGEHFALMDLYVYDDGKMTRVLEGLTTLHTVDFPTASFEESAKIEGALTDFTYILTKFDNLTNKTSVVKIEKYTYNTSAKSFTITSLTVVQAPEGLYLHQLTNGTTVGRGLVIKDIAFKKGTDSAYFTLSGDLEVKGRLVWDNDYINDLLLIVSENEDLPIFVIEGSSDVLEYQPRLLEFRNSEDLQKALDKKVLARLQDGESVETVALISDIKVTIKIGSEGGADCKFLGISK